jgi:hypothetical protein
MVDMRELVLQYHYDPRTGGLNSLKAVLPAVLAASEPMQGKYSQPIYGSADGIPSHNYADWAWVRRAEDGSVIDPYSLLPPVDTGLTPEQLSFIAAEESLDDGAAAMMAYARLQFMDMPDVERQAIAKALLKYCELDTFAMVLLWEYWRSLC